MRPATLPHPLTGGGLHPIGYRRNGAPIYPILGGSEDAVTGDDAGDDSQSDDDAGDGDDKADDQADDGEDSLGDAGKKALDAMKQQRNAARREARDLKRRIADLEAKAGDGKDGDDAEAVKAEARREALAEANERILRSEVKAAAAGKLADPADALRLLDLSALEVDDDGSVDEDEIADAIDDLVKRKPYLAAQGGRKFTGTADQGTRNGGRAKPGQVTRAELAQMTPEQINKALDEGRLTDLLSGEGK